MDNKHRCVGFLLLFAARRADPLLCAHDGGCTGRFDCTADKELWQTARMAAPSHTIVAHGTAEYAPRRRRWGGMGFAQARSCNIGPFRHALYRRPLLCGAAGGFLAAKIGGAWGGGGVCQYVSNLVVRV